MLVGCCFLLTPKNFKIQNSKLRRVNRRFFLAARHNPSKTWLLLSLRSVSSKLNIKRHATEDDLSSDEWHLYTQL